MLIAEARPICDRLLALRKEMGETEARLSSLLAMRLPRRGAAPRLVAVPKEVVNAVNNREKPWVYVPPGAPDEGEAAWKGLHARLVGGDVEARLDINQ